MTAFRILIVEDDMIIAANISLQLSKLGYEVTGIETRGEEAVHHALENAPDLILMDIHLIGRLDGIATARMIQAKKKIPLIYLTSNIDDATFQLAKETNPFAFISKPFNKLDLERAISLAVNKIDENLNHKEVEAGLVEFLEDRVFIRNQNKLIKILLEEILYVEAERNYCKIITTTQAYTVVCPLGQLFEDFTKSSLVRVHRSFLVNISHLDAVADSHLEIKGKIVPMSKSFKEQLFKRIHKI
jgi:DNA-binding LytR/AlgR family response regulator